MKIVMLCEFYQPATELQENHLVREYRALGYEVTVVTSTFESIFDFYEGKYDKNIPESVTYDLGAKIVRLKYRWHFTRHIRAHRSISKILEDEKPDLIYVHDIMLNILECAKYIQRNPQSRMILDYHADFTNSGRNWISRRILHGTWRKWFLDRSRPHLSRIFPIVPGGARFLGEIYGIKDSEMELLPLGADMTWLTAKSSTLDTAEVRKQFNLSENSFLIFTGGKLDPHKRTEILIQAVRQLRDLNIEVVIAGDTQIPGRLEKLMAEAGDLNGSTIKFLGWQSTTQIEELMIIADVAVFPASQTILWQKAVAAGLPLIVGDSGDQNPSYMNGGNIIVSAAFTHDSKKLGETIRNLFEDKELRHQMHQSALRVGMEVLNWKLLAQQTLKFNDRK
jgi:glycosyltransferase involved in cell wall biosynthesis